MPDLKATLTKKVGPLPLGVWLGVGVVGLYVLHKRTQAAATPTGTQDTTAPQAAMDQTFPSSSPVGYTPNYGGASGSGYYDSGSLGSPQIVVQSAPAVDTTKTTWQQKLLSLQQLIAGLKAQLSNVNSRLKSIATALKKAKPGSTQYQTLLNEYRAELSKRDALSEQIASTGAQIPVVQSQLLTLT